MVNQYCFDLENKLPDNFDISKFKKFINNLYIGSDEIKFSDKLPFDVVYAQDAMLARICLYMIGAGKKNIERIEEINKKLKPKNLKFNGIQLKLPYRADIETGENWWIEPEGKQKWNSLVQRGPYFADIMESYIPLGASLIYDQKKYPLSSSEEKVARFYANRIISEETGNVTKKLTKDDIFNTNFWNDFKQYLTPYNKKHLKIFSKIDWSDLTKKIKDAKIIELTDEQKQIKKENARKKALEYGFAYIDGHREKVGQIAVEQAGIFMGVGNNPKRGKIKKEIIPNNITLNLGKNDPIPKSPDGYVWGNVIQDKNAIWLAKWKDDITDKMKYIHFSVEGKFKGKNDLEKYEIARKLNKHIDSVRERYNIEVASKNLIKSQLGTALFLIDHLGLRVGGEKDEDEAETFGVTTLQVNHVKTKKPDIIIFDFLGKDSVQFFKEIRVPKTIYNNIKKFQSGKQPDSNLFDKIDAKSVNAYLKEFDNKFTAKVFRTRLASSIMFNILQQTQIPDNLTTILKIKAFFNSMNKKVAEILNHTRSVSQKVKDSLQNDKVKLENDKKNLRKASTETEKKKLLSTITKLTEKIERKEDVLNVAISTSLTNYIDPRIVVVWSEKHNFLNKEEQPVVYTAALLKKFKWAITTTTEDWNYNLSPIQQIGEELEPNEKDEPAVSIASSNSSSSIIDEPPIILDNIIIEPYSDKTFVVKGNTIIYKENLRQLGGKWNPNLTDKSTNNKFGAWIFQNKSKSQVEEWKNNILKPQSNITDIESYNNLLNYCNTGNSESLIKVSYNVMKWINPISTKILTEKLTTDKKLISINRNITKYYKILLDYPLGNDIDKWVVYTKKGCSFCQKAINFLKDHEIIPKVIVIDENHDKKMILFLNHKTNNYSPVPKIFNEGKFIGGFDKLEKLPQFS